MEHDLPGSNNQEQRFAGPYDSEELGFLGISSLEILRNDATPKDLHAFNQLLYARGKSVAVPWYHNSYTVALAKKQARDRLRTENHSDEWTVLEDFGYQAPEFTSGPLLGWLLSAKGSQVRDWSKEAAENEVALEAIGSWLGEPGSELSTFLVPALPLDQWVGCILKRLTSQERHVLSARFGIDPNGGQLTLEAIGSDLGISRERVRQLENRALRKLRNGGLRRTSLYFLHYTIRSHNGLIFLSESQQPSRNWLRVTFGSLPAFLYALTGEDSADLAEVGIDCTDGILLGKMATDSLRKAWENVTDVCQTVQFPQPLMALASELVCGTTLRDVAVVLQWHPRYTIASGHLVKRGGPLKHIRAARLARKLHRINGPVPAEALGALAATREDHHSPQYRECWDALSIAPHLTMNLSSRYWIALQDSAIWGQKQNPIQTFIEAPVPVPPKTGAVTEESPLADKVYHCLASMGPSRSREILEALCKYHGTDFKMASINAMLSMHPERFVRLAPGIFSARNCLPRPLPPDFPLRETDVYCYTLARQAGEPQSLFPLWTPRFEQTACLWAKDQASADLFRGLLNIARPDQWPISPKSFRSWRSLADREGVELPQRKNPGLMSHPMPSPDDLFSLYVYSRQSKGISWISSNIVLGQRLNIRGSALALAFMSLSGWLQAPEHWAHRHTLSYEGEEIAARILASRQECGSVTWLSAVGQELAEHIAKGLSHRQPPWLSPSARLALEARVAELHPECSASIGPAASDRVADSVELDNPVLQELESLLDDELMSDLE